MADPYTEYLKAINKENISKDPYSKFIELSKKQEPIVSDPYADYLRQINLQQQGVTPNQGGGGWWCVCGWWGWVVVLCGKD